MFKDSKYLLSRYVARNTYEHEHMYYSHVPYLSTHMLGGVSGSVEGLRVPLPLTASAQNALWKKTST